MKIEEHRFKALRIEHSLERLTDEDYEALIEGAMLAGTHWFNALLHQERLIPETRDAMHAEFLTVSERRRIAAVAPAALAAIDTIEAFRTLHVRGDTPGGVQAAKRARDCLAELRAAVT